MRKNSIHVTEDILAQVLLQLHNKYNISKQQTKLLAKDVAIACKHYTLTHRKVAVTNQKLLTKTQRINTSGMGGAVLFSSLMLMQRQRLKHVGIVKLTPNSPEWPELKVIVSFANQFALEFGLKEKAAYSKYIEIALSKMKKFSWNKIKGMHTAICQEYEAIQKLELDPTPSKTKEAYDLYNWTISNKTGIPNMGYDKIPEKYAIFVDIKNQAKQIGIDVKKYIAAQFEAFGFKDGVPDPLQMIGDKATARVMKYCFEHNINLKQKPTLDIKKIKNANNNH
jgi:hypothetical protein